VKLFTRFITLWLAIAFAGNVLAADETWRKDRFSFGVGFYRPNVDTRISVSDPVSGRSGTLLDLEKDLDLKDRKSQFMIDTHFRFAKRHAIEFDYISLQRNSTKTILFEIDYDGDIFPIDADVNVKFETDVTRLAYRFSFINNEKMEIAASVGLHITDLKVGLNIEGDPESFNDVTAPLPTLGGSFEYHFSENWSFLIRGEWLDIEIDNVNGSLTSGLAELQWYPWRNFGFGLGYNVFDFDVSATKSDLTGSIKYKYDGPRLLLEARF